MTLTLDVTNWKSQLRKGLVEYCLLNLIRLRGRVYGLQMIDELRKHGLIVVEGTLYPLLSRLVRDGWLHAEWETQNNTGHPRKYYLLTPKGEGLLGTMNAEWDQVARAVTALREPKGEKK